MSEFRLTSKPASGMTNPPTGKVYMFFNSEDLERLTSINSSGVITTYVPQPVGAEQHGQLITVGQAGSGDSVLFENIKLAIDSITDSGITKPYALLVYPGVYSVGPVTVPEWVQVVTFGEGTVILNSTNNVSPMFTLSSNCSINHLFFNGGNNTSCVYVPTGVTDCYIEDCKFLTGKKSVEAEGSGTQVFVEECKMEPVVTLGVIVTNGAFVGMSSCFNRAITNVKCDASEMAINNGYMGGLGSGIGLSCVNGGLIRANTVSVAGKTEGIHVAGGGHIDLIGGALYSNTIDFKQDDFTSIITGQGISMHTDRLSLVNPDNIKIQFQSPKVGDEAFKVYNELTVGHAGAGRESAFGEGDSYTNGRLVYDYNGSVFTAIPTALDEIDTITHTMGTSANNMLYIASTIHDGVDYVKIFRIKLTVTAKINAPLDSFIIEFWNGTIWQEQHYMVADSRGKYIAHAETIFDHSQTTQVRFGCNLNSEWVKTDPMGLSTDYYWIRIRTLNTVTTQASIEQLKVGGSCMEINEDAFPEYFGNARQTVRLPFDWGSIEAANSSPSNIDHYVADNMAVGRVENSFQNGTIDRSGLNAFLPVEIDTSCPITLRWAFQSTSTGDVRWTVRWAKTKDTDSIYDNSGNAPTDAPNQKSAIVIHTVSSADKQDTVEVKMDISDFVAEREGGFGDMLWITIERNANHIEDTMGGNANIIQLVPFYVRWKNGGHL